jgi:hypothetical protein
MKTKTTAVKTAKAPSAKKAKVASSSAKGKKSKRVLAKAQGSQCFWVNEGPILSDLMELARALESMSKETYAYHVHDARNDFADWVEFVLGDTELAQTLRAVPKPKSAQTLIVRRLKIYDLK